MTEYNIHVSATTSTNGSGHLIYTFPVMLAIRAGIFPIRLITVTAISGTVGPSSTGAYSANNTSFNRHSAATISGGTALTPAAAREGSDDASATVRHGSATYNYTVGGYTSVSSVSVSGTANEIVQLGANNQDWKAPCDLVIAPGSVWHFKGVPSLPGYNVFLAGIDMWFDEERVTRSP